MKITLKIYKADIEQPSRVLEEGEYRLGTNEDCAFVLSGEEISPNHLELRITPSSVYITNISDLGEVRLNQEVIQTGEVQNLDQIEVGDYRFVVHFGEIEEKPELSGESSFNVANIGGNEGSFRLPRPQMAAVGGTEGNAALNTDTMVQMRPLVAKIIFTEGPIQGKEFFVEAYEVTLGRSRKADIFIDDEKLSRLHAKISRVGNGYRLIDLNSRNGTYVNGMRILEHPLASFDEIAIGHSKVRFMIHDVAADLEKKKSGTNVVAFEQTKSVHVDDEKQKRLLELAKNKPPPGPPPTPLGGYGTVFPQEKKKKNLLKVALIAGGIAVAYLYLVPGGEKVTQPTTSPFTQTEPPSLPVSPTLPEGAVQGEGKQVAIETPQSLPKEYYDLSPAMQRAIEGHWTSSLRAADKELYEDAVVHLRKIHENLPFYKQSRELLKRYEKNLKVKAIEQARVKSQKTEKQDLAIYLQEGIQYLKSGDFNAAAESFQGALSLDPNNAIAIQGMKAAQKKITDINNVPPDRDPEYEKKKLVGELFKQAVEAYLNKSYEKAIAAAEKIRKIEIRGETKYLSEAKQIIDKAKLQQKEEFEPFLIQAKEKYAEGDYAVTRDLCEEMVKRDPEYQPAIELLEKTKKQLNKLAKDNYVRGIILESMNKIDDAILYWKRGNNYVRPGDSYYEKIQKKLEGYQ